MIVLICECVDFTNITSPGEDGVRYRFDFKAVPAEKLGQPNEQSSITNYQVTVTCVESLHKSKWELHGQSLEKVLYWYAREKLRKELSADPSVRKHEVSLHTRNAPGSCPYDAGQIKFPNPDTFEVEITRRIGF